MRAYKLFLTILLLACLSLSIAAQDDEPIVLQIAMQDFMATSLDMQNALADFEAQHEGVQVQAVGFNFVLDNANTWKSYLQSGDVVFIEGDDLSPYITRSGYLLDLEPLYRIDNAIQSTHPAADSFVWGGSRWAMASGYAPLVVGYDTTIFEELALSTPDSNWTIDDLVTWANVLRDSGIETPIFVDEVTQPYFLRHIMGQALYDTSSAPVQASFQDTTIEATIATLRDLVTDGLIEFGTIYVSDTDRAPITISAFWHTMSLESYTQIPLGMHPSGFGISSGTDYPELAYELTRFLVQQQPVIRTSGGWAIYGDEDTFFEDVPFDASQGLRLSDTLFANDLMPAIQATNIDVMSALQNAEMRVQERLSAAAERQSETLVIPEAEPRNDTGSIIRFAIQTNLSPLPNRFAWESLAEEFAESRPDVDNIEIEPLFSGDTSLENLSGLYDCFYTQRNRVPDADLSTLSALTPLMDADLTFNPDDFVGTMLDSVSRDNQIWGFPMDAKPFAMWITEAFLDESSIDLSAGMTIGQFNQLLASAENNPVIVPYNYDGIHALLLIYAYDGIPYDYRNTPVTIDFTSEATVDASRRLLSLIENEQLDYRPFAEYGSSSGTPPIIIAPMDPSNVRSGNLVTMSSTMSRPDSPYHPYLFPRGDSFAPVSYNTGTAYISSDTDFRNACYDFLSFVSGEPTLFDGLPVRFSTMNALADLGLRQPESIAFYRQFAQLVGRDDTIVIPSIGSGTFEEQTRQRIFLKALDLTVDGTLSLEEALSQAETIATEFQACLDSADPSGEMTILMQCMDITQSWFER